MKVACRFRFSFFSVQYPIRGHMEGTFLHGTLGAGGNRSTCMHPVPYYALRWSGDEKTKIGMGGRDVKFTVP